MGEIVMPLLAMGMFYAGYRLGGWEAREEAREIVRSWKREG